MGLRPKAEVGFKTKYKEHLCMAQVTAGRIDWSANEQKSVSKQTGPDGVIWADVIHKNSGSGGVKP